MARRFFILLVLLLLTFVSSRSASSREIQLDDGVNLTEKLSVGEKLRLRCNSSADVTWYKDGIQLIPKASLLKITRQALKFRSVQLSDAGRYRCDVKLESGSILNHSITLIIYDASETKPHADILQDVAAAHGPEVVEQRVNTYTTYQLDHGKVETDINGMNRANLTPMSLVQELEGDDVGKTNKPADEFNETKSQSLVAPVFTKPAALNKIISKSVGSELHLRCPAKGNPQPNITWTQNGGSISHLDNMTHYEDWSLILENLVISDAGNYTCTICNDVGCISFTTKLNIDKIPSLSMMSGDTEEGHENEPPTRIAGEYNETVPQAAPHFTRPSNMHPAVAKPAGNMLRLKCPAEGNPEPNITWTKDREFPYRHLGIIRYGRWSLTMEDLVVSDSGNYTCIVCNIHGCLNFTFKVDVIERLHHRPILTEAPKNLTVVVGHNESFRCVVLSDLHPHVEWFRGYYNSLNETDSSNVVKVEL